MAAPNSKAVKPPHLELPSLSYMVAVVHSVTPYLDSQKRKDTGSSDNNATLHATADMTRTIYSKIVRSNLEAEQKAITNDAARTMTTLVGFHKQTTSDATYQNVLSSYAVGVDLAAGTTYPDLTVTMADAFRALVQDYQALVTKPKDKLSADEKTKLEAIINLLVAVIDRVKDGGIDDAAGWGDGWGPEGAKFTQLTEHLRAQKSLEVKAAEAWTAANPTNLGSAVLGSGAFIDAISTVPNAPFQPFFELRALSPQLKAGMAGAGAPYPAEQRVLYQTANRLITEKTATKILNYSKWWVGNYTQTQLQGELLSKFPHGQDAAGRQVSIFYKPCHPTTGAALPGVKALPDLLADHEKYMWALSVYLHDATALGEHNPTFRDTAAGILGSIAGITAAQLNNPTPVNKTAVCETVATAVQREREAYKTALKGLSVADFPSLEKERTFAMSIMVEMENRTTELMKVYLNGGKDRTTNTFPFQPAGPVGRARVETARTEFTGDLAAMQASLGKPGDSAIRVQNAITNHLASVQKHIEAQLLSRQASLAKRLEEARLSDVDWTNAAAETAAYTRAQSIINEEVEYCYELALRTKQNETENYFHQAKQRAKELADIVISDRNVEAINGIRAARLSDAEKVAKINEVLVNNADDPSMQKICIMLQEERAARIQRQLAAGLRPPPAYDPDQPVTHMDDIERCDTIQIVLKQSSLAKELFNAARPSEQQEADEKNSTGTRAAAVFGNPVHNIPKSGDTFSATVNLKETSSKLGTLGFGTTRVSNSVQLYHNFDAAKKKITYFATALQPARAFETEERMFERVAAWIRTHMENSVKIASELEPDDPMKNSTWFPPSMRGLTGKKTFSMFGETIVHERRAQIAFVAMCRAQASGALEVVNFTFDDSSPEVLKEEMRLYKHYKGIAEAKFKDLAKTAQTGLVGGGMSKTDVNAASSALDRPLTVGTPIPTRK